MLSSLKFSQKKSDGNNDFLRIVFGQLQYAGEVTHSDILQEIITRKHAIGKSK